MLKVATSSSVARDSVQGGLWLKISKNAQGCAQIQKQHFAPPVHFSKPYWDGQALLIQAVSPTAGLLAGDRLTVDVEVDGGSHAVLYNPAVTRIHTMDKDAQPARAEQVYRVSNQGSFLEVLNEGMQLQKGSHFAQVTSVEVDDGADLFWEDIIWPGRLARGEAFAFSSYHASLEARCDGDLVALERTAMTPENLACVSWRSALGPSVLATFYVFTRKDLSECIHELHVLHDAKDCWVGASSLRNGGLVIRMVAASPILLRRNRKQIRTIVLSALGRYEVSVRSL